MRDRTQLPAQQKNTHVKAYALFNNQNEYAFLGEGTLEIVTDSDMMQSQHYIEVTSDDSGELFLRSRLVNSNVYERQKSTVILWEDPQQTLSNCLAMSFETAEICDRFWRQICSKIGKNYLEINGREKLEIPNQKNIYCFHDKIKNSYNLVAYHVLNSTDFMAALWEALHALNKKNQALTAIDIIRDLLSNFDPKIMQIFLVDPNFERFLQIYEGECNINFRSYYKLAAGAQELVKLSSAIKNKIELSLRAKFVKECVIDYAKDSMIQNMLTQVMRENQIEALISLLQEDCIVRIIEVYQSHKDSNPDQKVATDRKILTFLLQCVWILRIHHADNTKSTFLSSFYSSGMLRIMGELLAEGNCKALEVLSGVSALDPIIFFNQFTNDYRANASNNLIRIIAKQFCDAQNDQFVNEALTLFRNLQAVFRSDRKLFEFINKTLILSIFMSCKNSERILQLIIFCSSELNTLKQMLEHIRKFEFFKSVLEKMKKKQISKKELLATIRIIKVVLECSKFETLNAEDLHKLNKQFVSLGIFQQTLAYLSQHPQANNMTCSAIIQNLSIIAGLKFNAFTEAVQQFDFGANQQKQCTAAKKYIRLIKQIKDDSLILQDGENQQMARKRVHRTLLQQEEQENYLQQEDKDEEYKEQRTKDVAEGKSEEVDASMQRLMQIRAEIGSSTLNRSTDIVEELKDRSARLRAKRNQEQTLEFDLGDLGGV